VTAIETSELSALKSYIEEL